MLYPAFVIFYQDVFYPLHIKSYGLPDAFDTKQALKEVMRRSKRPFYALDSGDALKFSFVLIVYFSLNSPASSGSRVTQNKKTYQP